MDSNHSEYKRTYTFIRHFYRSAGYTLANLSFRALTRSPRGYRVARLDRIVGKMADKSLCLFDVASLKLVSMQLQGSLNKISGVSKSAVATCLIFIVQS